MNEINIHQVYIALERVAGWEFENFFNAFCSSIDGGEFVPLGGVRDGGADAFRVYEERESGYFYQASKQEDEFAKIRYTVKRLHKFGRNPKVLIYGTARRIQYIDRKEITLSSELGVNIRIRDARYIASHINDSAGTRAAFNTYLRHYLDYLKNIGSSNIIAPSQFATSPAIFVFLRQEMERRQGKDSLINALADGLILWALEGTDPDKGILMSEKEIVKKIEATVPSSKTILRGIIPTRLKTLAKKPKGGGRPVRWHRKAKKFCLSYDIRKDIEKENTEDEGLRIKTLDIFRERIVTSKISLTVDQVDLAADVSLYTIQKAFEQEGIELAAFLHGKLNDPSMMTLADIVDKTLLEREVKPDIFMSLKEAILYNLHYALYDSTDVERHFFLKLSDIYTLLFCLQAEPKIVEYFQSMASDFYLYVGSDIIVRALSERYLRPENQTMRNALTVIRMAGGKLVLPEPVLDEVHTHLAASDFEYRNKYKGIEKSMTPTIAENIDRILIRAYFYALIEPPRGVTGPHDWSDFVNQFCNYHDLHTASGREQMRRYLLSQFHMDYITLDDLNQYYDDEEITNLTQKIKGDKKDDERLARNDAMLALAVYGRRNARQETSRVSEFGYRTWWLTGEKRILKHTGYLVDKYGTRYMMRPEFILNFISIVPSTAEIKRTYRNVFPNLLGMQLSRRIDPNELDKVLEQVAKAQELEPGRREAEMAHISDKLKGDFLKVYHQNL